VGRWTFGEVIEIELAAPMCRKNSSRGSALTAGVFDVPLAAGFISSVKNL
jgi:hypothetical protein